MASDEVRSDSDFVRSFMFSQPDVLRHILADGVDVNGLFEKVDDEERMDVV